ETEGSLPTVGSQVADVAASDHINYIFRDIRRVVADALQILGDQDELEGRKDDCGIFHHVGEEFAENLIAEMIDFVVANEDRFRKISIAMDQGIQAVANHAFGKLAHARQIDIWFDLRMAQNAQGGLRDIDGLVADALKVVVDARSRKDEAQVDGHGLLQRDKLHHAVVDFDLHFIDDFFFVKDARGERFVFLKHGLHGLMDGALGEPGHPKQALLQFFQIVIEMPFHQYSLRATAVWPNRKSLTSFA